MSQIPDLDKDDCICDVCGWCRNGCVIVSLRRSHQRVAICSHCLEDLREVLPAFPVAEPS